MLPRDDHLAPTSSSSNNHSILPATCSNLCLAKPRSWQPATTTTTTSRTQGRSLWAEKSHRTAFVVALVVPAVRAPLVRRTTSSTSTENIHILNVACTYGIDSINKVSISKK